MIQYVAVGIQNDVWVCYKREDYRKNLERIAFNIGAAVRYARADGPVRLVALAEGALGGFASWAGGNKEHLKAYRELAPEIPGKETDFLGQLCKAGNFYLIGQMQAKDPEFMEDRIFNIAFIINPKGEIILKHHKTACATVEPMTEPMDVWNRYLEKYGDDPVELSKAIWPVAHTEIGNIGTLVCNEGSFPEAGRALALNGAEIIYRTEYVEPMLSNGMFEIQNRSIAVANTCYVLTPHLSEIYGYKSADPNAVIPSDCKISWGHSRMYDYRGNVVSQCAGTGQSFVSGIVNIDGLREYRVGFAFNNYIKDMRVEQYQIIYDALVKRGGIYPKNICMQEPPMTEADREEVCRYGVNRAVELGIYTAPTGWKPYPVKKEVLERIKKSK